MFVDCGGNCMLCAAWCFVVLAFVVKYITRPAFDKRLQRAPEAPMPEELEKIHKQGFSAKAVGTAPYDAIIVGSGPGGLTTAGLLSRRGKRVLVLEQHDQAGGCTHSFKTVAQDGAGSFEFDTGLHYVGGNVGIEHSSFARVLGAVSDGNIQWEPMDDNFDVACFNMHSDYEEQDRFPIHKDWRVFRDNLKARFPDESTNIHKYFDMIFDCFGSSTPFFALKMLPAWLGKFLAKFLTRRFSAYAELTAEEVLNKMFKDEKLKAILPYAWGDCGDPPSRLSWAMCAMITKHYIGGSYFPKHGTSAIAQNIVPVIERSGGKVLVRAPVDRIVVDDSGTAIGVEVKGLRITAPVIISAVGAINTFTKLLPEPVVEKYMPDALRDIRARLLKPSTAHVTLFVGLDIPQEELQMPSHNLWAFDSYDHDHLAKLAEGWKDFPDWAKRPHIGGVFISSASARDSTYSTRFPGKSVVSVLTDLPYDFFKAWKNNRVKHRGEEYEHAKEVMSQHLVEVLYHNYPQTRGHVVHLELGTPISQEHYIGAAGGASYGCEHTPSRFRLPWLRYATPIKNFYMSGQDIVTNGIQGGTMGGALCAVAVSGWRGLQFLNLLLPGSWQEFKESQACGFIKPSFPWSK